MRLRQADPRALEFGAPPRAGSIALVALPIGLLAGLWLLAPTPATAPRLVTAAALGLVALVLLRLSVRPGRRIVVDVARRELVRPGRRVSLGTAPRLRLGGKLGDVERLKPAYSADLVVGRETHRIIEDPDPAVVLSDVRRMHAVFPMEIETGWGLPAWAILGDRDRLRRSGPAPRPSGVLFSDGYGFNYRAAGWTVAGTGSVIGLMMARSVITRVGEGEPANAVSIALPILVVAAILVMAAAVLTSKGSLSANGRLVWRRSVLGVPLRQVAIRDDALRFIFPVGPVPDHALHILVDCGSEVLSLPCPSGDAAARASRIEKALMGRQADSTAG